MEFAVRFARKHETKGAVRFQEVDNKGNIVEFKESQIGTLYIRKNALQLPFPDFVTVTIKTGS